MAFLKDLFPSKYLRADDLPKPVLVTIDSVVEEELNDGKFKPVVYFLEEKKGLVLNKTNAERIADITESNDTDQWAGHQIVIYRDVVQFQGKTTPCVRVQPPAPAPAAKPQARPVKGSSGGGVPTAPTPPTAQAQVIEEYEEAEFPQDGDHPESEADQNPPF